MSREQLIRLVMSLDPAFISHQRETLECECDCIMKKDPHYLIYNASKKELINYLENSIVNMNNLMDLQNKIIRDIKPPTYEDLN